MIREREATMCLKQVDNTCVLWERIVKTCQLIEHALIFFGHFDPAVKFTQLFGCQLAVKEKQDQTSYSIGYHGDED